MTLRLYDLRTDVGDIRPSPYCWMVKFALLHKGLAFETVALRFTEKENYPDPDYKLLPVLDDDGELVRDSAAIIAHLERKYPARPLVATPGEAAAADFYRAWLVSGLYPGLGPLTYVKVLDHLGDEGKAYFRETREARLGKRLEDLAADPAAVSKMDAALATLATPLDHHPFLGGEAANLCDYIVFSPLMWRRLVAAETPYKTPPAVAAWMERMLDLFDGYGRKAKRPS